MIERITASHLIQMGRDKKKTNSVANIKEGIISLLLEIKRRLDTIIRRNIKM